MGAIRRSIRLESGLYKLGSLPGSGLGNNILLLTLAVKREIIRMADQAPEVILESAPFHEWDLGRYLPTQGGVTGLLNRVGASNV